jgi:hypothetical protein
MVILISWDVPLTLNQDKFIYPYGAQMAKLEEMSGEKEEICRFETLEGNELTMIE